uniref:Toll-like receptor 7 n=1 Tax=Cyprinus carpio TaxID=7962 RepID=A0A8C1S136_CYPCA
MLYHKSISKAPKLSTPIIYWTEAARHLSQSSSLEEVRVDVDKFVPPAPRKVEMRRDPVLGFGFVAGSEKPVVVRSVTPGGPSEGKLIPGDEIVMINEEAVSSAARERVIDLVRSCKESIILTVVQPYPVSLHIDCNLRLNSAEVHKLNAENINKTFADQCYFYSCFPPCLYRKEWGLAQFLPPAVLSSMKEKNIKKALTHILKTNQNLVPPGKKLTALQAKVHYLKYLSDLRLYGGQVFKSTLVQGEKHTEVTLLVGPRYGISHVINTKTNLVALLADFSHVNRIEMYTEDERNVRVELHVLDVKPITLIMESSDAMNLACLTAGYYRLLVDSRRSIFNMANNTAGQDLRVKHNYQAIDWNYGSCSACDEEFEISPTVSEMHQLQHRMYADEKAERASRASHMHPQPYFSVPKGKPQESPRSAKVSFIFGDPPLDSVNPQNLGYQRLMEDIPEVLEEHRYMYAQQKDYKPLEASLEVDGFQYGSHMVYGDAKIFGTTEGIEEPLLRDICYAETTDDAEDDDDISCEEDMMMMMMGEIKDKANSLLSLSESSDDIIDLTSLPPPPEGDDEEDSDDLLQSLNLAIAAPPPGFRDSSDEDDHQERKGLKNDIPVSLIDSVPTQVASGTEEVFNDAVVSTLQALEALAASEEQSHPQSDNSSGVEISRSFSPESSSDSGNETNSSEMTESSELAAAQKLSENSLKMLVATAEGYQTLAEEETEFRLVPCEVRVSLDDSQSAAVANLCSDHFEMEPETMETKSLTDYFNKMHRDMVMGMPQGKIEEQDGGMKLSAQAEARQMNITESEDLVGMYNNFSGRDSQRSGPFDLERMSYAFQESNQRLHMILNNKSEEHIYSEVVGDVGPLHADRVTQKASLKDSIDLNTSSPAKEQFMTERARNEHQQSKAASSEQEVTRLYEYHLSKRMSSLQNEGIHSLQSSQCSSIDAGCSTGSSSCVTPMDSPLCTVDSVHLHGESSLKGLGYTNQKVDGTFSRKNLGQAGQESGREGCQRLPKIRETTGTASLKV